jgi:hypothetical protein
MSPFVTGLVTAKILWRSQPVTIRFFQRDRLMCVHEHFETKIWGRMICQVSDLPVLDLRRFFCLEPYSSLSWFFGGCGWGRTNNALRAEDLQSPGVTNFPTHPKYQLPAAGSTTFNSSLNSTGAPEKKLICLVGCRSRPLTLQQRDHVAQHRRTIRLYRAPSLKASLNKTWRPYPATIRVRCLERAVI